MTEIRQEFIQQAIQLTRNAEVLPGGVNGGVTELAAKLQHAADTNTPLRVKLGMDPKTGFTSRAYCCYEKA